MKYFYSFSLFILFIATIIGYIRLNSLSESAEKYSEISKKLQNDTDIYLRSLTSLPINRSKVNIDFLAKDAINIEKNNCLVFYFSPNECMTCIDENIYELLNVAKKFKINKIVIATSFENNNYLKLFSIKHKNAAINFGILLKPTTI